MSRKIGILILAFLFIAPARFTRAQQPGKITRIGFLSSGSLASSAPLAEAFREGLQELGYVEGKNIIIEYRYAEGRPERLPSLAADLVRLKVDTIVTGGRPSTRAGKQATSTIPIVMAAAGNPVGNRFVASLARPGGNITGLTTIRQDLTGKRLKLLQETVSMIFRVAVLWGPPAASNLKKGAKPADLPVEQPMKFELIINLKTAKQIGHTIPPNVLAKLEQIE
jgi:putative ABC transport system substrate-binding protein